MMKRLFAGRFIRSIGYLLSVHLVALLFFFGLRVALFIATDYDFPKEISEDYALQSGKLSTKQHKTEWGINNASC